MNDNKRQQKSLETIIVSRDHTERQTRLEHKKLVKIIERKGFVELPAFQVTKK